MNALHKKILSEAYDKACQIIHDNPDDYNGEFNDMSIDVIVDGQEFECIASGDCSVSVSRYKFDYDSPEHETVNSSIQCISITIMDYSDEKQYTYCLGEDGWVFSHIENM